LKVFFGLPNAVTQLSSLLHNVLVASGQLVYLRDLLGNGFNVKPIAEVLPNILKRSFS
jgi:hypothetical protein